MAVGSEVAFVSVLVRQNSSHAVDPRNLDFRRVGRSPGSLFLFLFAAALAFGTPRAPSWAQEGRKPALERKVRLEVQADSWRDEGAYPIAKELKEKLAQAGVGATEKASSKVDAVLEITYSETKGKEYKEVGGEKSLGFGSELSLRVLLKDAQGEELLSIGVEGEPGSFITKAPLEASLDALRDKGVYRYLDSFIAAALGIRSAFPNVLRSLSWADAREPAEALLKKTGYRPQTKLEEAYLAIGREEWDACIKLGEVAADPLLELFERQARVPGNLDDKLIPTLVSIGGSKVKVALLSELASKKDQLEPFLGMVLALVEGLGKLGETKAIPILEGLAQSDEEDLAKASKKVLRTLRLAPKPAEPLQPGSPPAKASPAPEAPGNPAAERFNARGLEMLRAGRAHAAAALFSQAIDLVPEHGPYYWNRARSRWILRDWESAREDFDRAARRAPALEDEVRLRIYLLDARRGNAEKARTELKEYYDERPAGPDGAWFLELSRTLLGAGSPAGLMKTAGDSAARKAQASYYLGMKALLSGDRKAAADSFRDAAGGEGFDAESARIEIEDLEKGGR